MMFNREILTAASNVSIQKKTSKIIYCHKMRLLNLHDSQAA